MEVLKDSLQPSLTNSVLQWNPPDGYSVVDSSPRNLGTLHSNSSYMAYAFLRRDRHSVADADRQHGPAPKGGATISGTVGGEDVRIDVKQMALPELTDRQSDELWSILWQTAVWSKLCSLEMQILSSSRKNSQNENDDLEPAAKRPRLNGITNHHSNPPSIANATGENGSGSGISQQDRAALCQEIAKLSLDSGIPCSLTYFTSDAEGGRFRQVMPNFGLTSAPRKPLPNNGLTLQHQRQLQRMYGRRKRPRSHHRPHRRSGEPTEPAFSLTSLAKNSISAVGSTLKSVVNLATFGLLSQESSMPIENGQRIEDELELQQNKDSRLHWDDNRGGLVYPNFYYRSNSPSHSSSTHSGHHAKSKKARKLHNHLPGQQTSSTNHTMPMTTPMFPCNAAIVPVNGMSLPQVPLVKPDQLLQPGIGITVDRETGIPMVQPMTTTDDLSAGEEDEFTISDSESDSSVDPDWDDLRRPNELLPLIHMQLFCGAWPMVRAFSYAVGVPLEEMRKLPLSVQPKTTPTEGRAIASTVLDTQVPPPSPNAANSHVGNSGCPANKLDDENNAHFWTTSLAIACLEEYFAEFHTEWELVALKGREWLRENASQTELSMNEVQRVARELVLRQS